MPERAAAEQFHGGLPIDPLGLWKQSRPSFLESSHLRSWQYLSVPGLMTLTLIFPLRSAVQVRAKERTAALLALYTLVPGNPVTPAIELFRMIDPPSFISGRAFCTVNKVPRTLTLNVSSKPFSVIEPSGLPSSP